MSISCEAERAAFSTTELLTLSLIQHKIQAFAAFPIELSLLQIAINIFYYIYQRGCFL